MATLVAVNVGMPKDIQWQGKTVRTAVWKEPVAGRVMVRRLNIDGDGQGDLAGHGGEHRAVMVYQLASYRYWEDFLKRSALEYGSFGENFTVDGLPDDEVCIGDRYRVGDALLEVTQPRVTCYRVAIRMQDPRMANLLVAHHRPGFYFRVVEEGLVGAGDLITREREGSGMTVAEVDGLLYLPNKSREKLERATKIPALSKGWRDSFDALLEAGPEAGGNAGLTGVVDAPPAWNGFRQVRVASIHSESPTVRSFVIEAVDGEPLPCAQAGQFIVLKLTPPAPHTAIIRSYSLSDTSTSGRYRISVKRGQGEGSQFLHDVIHEGDTFGISAARGTFCLIDDDHPIVLWGAGIGITPLLAMLRHLASEGAVCSRPVYWIYGARDGTENVFIAEVTALLARLPASHRVLAFSSPRPDDRSTHTFDLEGRIGLTQIDALGVPKEARFYLCGPTTFLTQTREALIAAGYLDVVSELFGAQKGFQPGVVGAHARPPHAPANESPTAPVISFVRSGLAVHWSNTYGSLLEFAEACDVPVRWSCRSGVCHSCETSLIGGRTAYTTDPPDEPAAGRILICCSQPTSDIEIDL